MCEAFCINSMFELFFVGCSYKTTFKFISDKRDMMIGVISPKRGASDHSIELKEMNLHKKIFQSHFLFISCF